MPYTPDYKKVIYIIRDGRDVMVSAYHYYYFPIKISFLDFLQMDIWPGPWDEHLQSWLDNAHLLDLLLIRYEDLLEDPFQQLKNIAHFIGLNTDDEKVDRAVRHSSFTALKKMEANNDSRFSGLPGLKFFRSGKSGQWRQYFGPEHKDVFKRQTNTLLMRLGYINTTEW